MSRQNGRQKYAVPEASGGLFLFREQKATPESAYNIICYSAKHRCLKMSGRNVRRAVGGRGSLVMSGRRGCPVAEDARL